ncbi:MAG: AAA family ATPase [Deltaproteobacteria bacterium]|nr:AAA family ATPase [Deltaproteobacteria bacterium]
MDFSRLVALLSSPDAYPHPVDAVELHQTHISAVFLAGPYAYKIKKPLDLGFLDFTTLERRAHFCREEVRLNRRLAPTVYLGVVPVALGGGRLRVDGEGDVAEWAVWMRRLPDEATLRHLLARGDAGEDVLVRFGRRLAAFHAGAEAGEHVSACAGWPVVARNARENFEQTANQVGEAVSAAVWDRVRTLTERRLADSRALIEDRARRGLARDTHGDLHLDHVYVFPDREPPDDLVAVDCIEFNERFRYADPVADASFLVMDLIFTGRRGLARLFANAYFEAARDAGGADLLPLYVAYRAAVRAKVEGMKSREAEVPPRERREARQRAGAHWLLALGQLEEPAARPCLVLVGGLPGTGKSTLARGLAEAAGFQVISSDEVRKELAGLAPTESAAADFGAGLYTAAWNDRVYAECLRRAEEALSQGRRVAVDASFREEGRRRAFLGAARRWAVPAVLLLCRADGETVRRRLSSRIGDASDATWEVHRRAAAVWEEAGAEVRAASRDIASGDDPGAALGCALSALSSVDLL